MDLNSKKGILPKRVIQFYTGFNCGYNGDDFAQNRVTIWKKFEASGIRFKLLYTTGSGMIFINAYNQSSGAGCDYSLTSLVIDSTTFDIIRETCKEILKLVK